MDQLAGVIVLVVFLAGFGLLLAAGSERAGRCQGCGAVL